MDYDTPKNRKGKHGGKKDQKQKGQQEHRLGSSKYIRLKESIIENKLNNNRFT